MVGGEAEMSGVEIRKRANEESGGSCRRGREGGRRLRARFHFLSNENLFRPFSFHPGVFLILCKGAREGRREGRL